MKLSEKLQAFVKERRFRGKGPLCVALHVTRCARAVLPLDEAQLIAEKGTQVKGLGRHSVQAILAEHGITRVLAREAGRTSRGSVDNMRVYVKFLKALPAPVDFVAIESFWIQRVRQFFAGKPFKLRVDAALSVRAAVRDLLNQARARQAEVPGERYEGAMLQHLVGAKLDLVLGPKAVAHHSASEADEAEDRAGDFVVGDVAIHVTTHPGEAVIGRCVENLNAGLRPLLVTEPSRIAMADGHAEKAGILEKLEVLDIEQFLAANLHERALFEAKNRGPRTSELIERYNFLIDAHETDPALKIEIAGLVKRTKKA